MTSTKPGSLAGWVLIAPEISADDSLSSSEKLLWGRINGLSCAKGYCWALNQHLAECIGIQPRTIPNLVSRLIKKGFVLRHMIRRIDGKEVLYEQGDGPGRFIERRLYPIRPHHANAWTSSRDHEDLLTDRGGHGSNRVSHGVEKSSESSPHEAPEDMMLERDSKGLKGICFDDSPGDRSRYEQAVKLIERVWGEQPHLINHRSSTVRNACGSYLGLEGRPGNLQARMENGFGLDEILSAIRNLNRAVGSDHFWWTARYDLRDLLGKGQGTMLERFAQGLDWARVSRRKNTNVVTDEKRSSLKQSFERRLKKNLKSTRVDS